MKWSIIPLTIVTVCVIVGSAFKSADANVDDKNEPLRNVILITISTLRADHVDCLGYERHTTPSFDEFAKENVLFRSAFSTSGWTMPAHGSIFTSLYPSRHGATHIDKRLDDEHYTLAEILRDKGYYCVGFCCNPRLDQEHGFAQGFDLYDDYSVSIMLNSLTFGNEEALDINKQRTNALINDAAIRWLQNNTHKPFFMFIHYYDNHWDYLPTKPYAQLYDPEYDGPIDGTEIAREPLFSNPPNQKDIRHMIALYDGEVKQTDNDLGEMLKALKDKNLLDNSVVIIMGDHGEQFYEHGHTSHQGVYEELIHIPLTISVPEARLGGRVIDSLVSQVDILPTILDYLEINVPDACCGKSLKPLIEARAEKVNDFIFTEYAGGAVPDIFAVRSAHYKYCQEAKKESYAYDLAKDPGEQNMIIPEYFPDEVKLLEKNLRKFLKIPSCVPKAEQVYN